jgi:hypothetical protein
MSLRAGSFLGVVSLSLLGLLAQGCRSGPAPVLEEDEDIAAKVMQSEMLEHRARLEPKTGLVIPINSHYKIATPADAVAGIEGKFEAVQKGMWFGLNFDFATIESENPLARGASQSEFLAAKTEQLMHSLDRYELLLTWNYDIPTGEGLYYPIFRAGLGMGAVAIHPNAAEGNALLEFNELYSFVGRPTIGFRFPFHENVGAFIEAMYNYIPEARFNGTNRNTGTKVDIGNRVELSTINVFAGISFEW